MGAQLFGIVLFGPHTIDPQRIREADAEYIRQRGEAEGAVIYSFTGPVVPFERLSISLRSALDDLVNNGQICEDEDYADIIKEFLSYGTAFVFDVVRMWETAGCNDIICRMFPDHAALPKGWQCVVAGMTSWGDGPEEYSAQMMFERADSLGVLERLGIQ